MLSKFRSFLERTTQEDQVSVLNDDELQLATAALLIRASVIDGNLDDIELDKLKRLLRDRFELSETDVGDLLARGKQTETDAIDLYSFTKVIKDQLDIDGRRRVVEMLWEVAFADGTLDDFESNLIWRVSELIGVSTRERVELRKTVAARHEDKP